jgi:hypothetical protein
MAAVTLADFAAARRRATSRILQRIPRPTALVGQRHCPPDTEPRRILDNTDGERLVACRTRHHQVRGASLLPC